jgi:hypothetical protein
MTHMEARGKYVKERGRIVGVKRVWNEGSVVDKSDMHAEANRRT